MGKKITSRKIAMDEIRVFLAQHNVTLNEIAKERLSEFKFNKYTEIIYKNNYIEIYHHSYNQNWTTMLALSKNGTSTIIMGNYYHMRIVS